MIIGSGAVTRSAAIWSCAEIVAMELNCLQAEHLGDVKATLAIDRTASWPDFAKTLRATDWLDTGVDDPLPAVLDLITGRDVAHVFVAVGARATIEAAFLMFASGGALVPENGVSIACDPAALASVSIQTDRSAMFGEIDAKPKRECSGIRIL